MCSTRVQIYNKHIKNKTTNLKHSKERKNYNRTFCTKHDHTESTITDKPKPKMCKIYPKSLSKVNRRFSAPQSIHSYKFTHTFLTSLYQVIDKQRQTSVKQPKVAALITTVHRLRSLQHNGLTHSVGLALNFVIPSKQQQLLPS